MLETNRAYYLEKIPQEIAVCGYASIQRDDVADMIAAALPNLQHILVNGVHFFYDAAHSEALRHHLEERAKMYSSVAGKYTAALETLHPPEAAR